MKHADIVARLKDKVPALKTVAGASGFLALKNGAVKKSPSGFVVPGGDQAGLNSLPPNSIRQPIGIQFTVLLGFLKPGIKGDRGVDAYDDIKKEIQAALIGWRAPDTDMPITYVRSNVLGIDPKAGTAWFELKFQTHETYHQQGENP